MPRTKTKPASARRVGKASKEVQAVRNSLQRELTDVALQNRQMVMNLMTSRLDWLRSEQEGTRDIDKECGYPFRPDKDDFKKLIRRFGIAKRYNDVLPQESWAVDPDIYEDENPDEETEFEKKFKELEGKHHLIHYLERIDAMSGIGRFGVLLLGLADGKKLNQPARGVNEKGERLGSFSHELAYIRAFDESNVRVKTIEKDTRSPRYGWPTMYEITFSTTDGEEVATINEDVHWTRIVHIADNCESSEVFGVPRLENVYNTLLDLKKMYGGSAEMFWKGAFPGLALETHPEAEEELEMDEGEIEEEVWKYFEGLQRSLQIAGVTVKQLAPQVADPTNHINASLNFLTMTIGCPLRIFMGSEMAHLASDQDQGTWNQRVAKRQKKYVIPRIIRRTLDHLIMLGILPEAEYKVSFPDIHTPSAKDKAAIAKTMIEAISKYVATGAERLMPPKEFFTFVLGFTMEEVQVILDASEEYAAELEARQQKEMEMEVQQATAMAKVNPVATGMQGPNGKVVPKGKQTGARVRGKPNPNGGVKRSNNKKPIGGRAA